MEKEHSANDVPSQMAHFEETAGRQRMNTVQVVAGQHSKATSLVKRKTSEMEDDEMMQYTDSNAEGGTHYFQLEGTGTGPLEMIRRKKTEILIAKQKDIVMEEDEGIRNSIQHVYHRKPVEVTSRFVNEINVECTNLISKLHESHRSEDQQESSDDLLRNSKGSSVVLQQQLSPEKREKSPNVLGNSKSATEIASPSDPQVRKRTLENKSSLAQQDGGFNLNNSVLMVGDPPSSNEELRRRIGEDAQSLAGKTSATLAVSHMPQNIKHQVGANYNLNSETDTQQDAGEKNYNTVSRLKEDEVFHINRENNPIFILHNPSQGELNQSRTNILIRKSQETAKAKHNLGPYFQEEDYSRQGAVPQNLLTGSNKITFRNLDETPTLSKNVPYPVVESASPSPQADFDMQNFNAFTGHHLAAANAKPQGKQHAKRNDSDEEFARGDSIPISETLRKEINFVKDIGASRYVPFTGGDSHKQPLPQQDLHAHAEDEEESEYDDEEEEEETKDNLLRTDKEKLAMGQQSMVRMDDDNFRHSVKDLQPAPPQTEKPSYNDDVIYNRLPKNFFVQEAEEQFDLGEVMASIKQMRADFVGYMNESKVQDKLEEINDMIMQPPEKFIERQLKAMGLEGGESILFEKVLSQTPSPSLPASQADKYRSFIGFPAEGHTMTMRDAEPGHPSLQQQNRDMFNSNLSEDNFLSSQCQTEHNRQHSRGTSAGRVQFQEPNPQSVRRSIDDAISQKGNVEEIEDKISRRDFEQFPKPGHDIYGTPKATNAQPKKPAITSHQQPQLPKQLAIKGLRMADYFKDGLIEVEDPPLRSRSPSPNNSAASGEDLAQPIKEMLVERLEQEILGNIDVNFMFNKGERLRFSLIDPSRVYKIMLKIKEIAQKQVYDRGTKQIDYTEIVQFLEEEDQFLTEGEKSQMHQNQNKHLQRVPTAEPRKTKIPFEEIDDSQWVQIVDFMRKNPKLMLQMLPDTDPTEEDIKDQSNSAAIIAQSMAAGQGIKNVADLQAAKDQEDAKRMAKLKALSLKYNSNKKGFLDAIDRFQEKEFMLNSPKGKERNEFGPAQPFHTKQKVVQVKSISLNQRKVKRAHAQQQNRANQSEIVQDLGSDPETCEARNKTMIYEKQFQYTSSNMAKGVYSSLPYALPPQNIVDLAGSGSENENRSQNRGYQQHSMLDQLATKTNGGGRRLKRPTQSQQQKDLGIVNNRSFNKGAKEMVSHGQIDKANINKRGALGSNLSNLDGTTMTGGTATGNLTNMKNFRNNITAQIKTISQEGDSDGPAIHGIVSTTSMFQKFQKQEQPQKSLQRRPITASAAVGGGGFKPIRLDPKIYSDQSSVNFGPTVACNTKQLRLPSASGISSNSNQFQFKAQEVASSVEGSASLPKYQHFAKFVSEKRITWMSSGQQIQAVARQTEDLNQSLKSSYLINQMQDDQTSAQQRLSPEQLSTKAADLPPQIQKRTKTQRQQPQKRLITEAEAVEVDQDLSNFHKDTSPDKKTQQYISKIAPNLKHKDTTGSLYPKFVGRLVKRHTPMAIQSQDQSKISETISVDNSSSSKHVISNVRSVNTLTEAAIQKGLKHKRASIDQGKHQVTTNFRDNQHMDDGDKSIPSSRTGTVSQSEQNPGGYPKFVKNARKYKQQIQNAQSNQNIRASSSNSVHQVHQPMDSAPMVNSEVQTSGIFTGGYQSANEQKVKEKKHNQSMQTRVGGVKNKLLVSPSEGGYYGGDLQNCNFDDCYSSNESENAAMERRRKLAHSKMVLPVVDWAFTPLFSRALKNDISFNADKEMQIYEEKEVDYVIDMMKNKYKDFKRSDLMRPFYLKAQLTLQCLFVEQGQESHFERLMHKYKEITIENTMKLLIRCKLNFNCRVALFEIMKATIDYELNAVQFKDLVQGYHRHKVDQEDIDQVKAMGDKVVDTGHQMLVKIRNLRQVHTQYKKVPYIFRQRDYVTYVKNEMNEVRRIMSVFKIRTEQDIAEDERKLREAEELHLQDLLRKQQILQLEQELADAGVDINPEGPQASEDEYEEIEEVDPNSLKSPLRVVP